MKIGFIELAVIFIVALIVLGPDKLPVYAKKLGKSVKDFKNYSGNFAKEINESLVEPLSEVSEPLKKVVKDIEDPLKEVKQTIDGIGKPTVSTTEKLLKSDTNHRTLEKETV